MAPLRVVVAFCAEAAPAKLMPMARAEAAARAALRVLNGFILVFPLLMGSVFRGMRRVTRC